MAAEEAGGVGRAPACLCVLCGLPAAGKSTLARTVLGTAARHGWRASVVPYDDLIPGQAFQTRGVEDGDKRQETHTEWKLHRQAVLRRVERFLEKPRVSAELPGGCQINGAAWERCIQALRQPEGAPLLLLLDDNFYYPSMRYEVYQLARKCEHTSSTNSTKQAAFSSFFRYSLGFCQVYLQCDVESCISRNQSRSEPIPTEVILEMEKRLESPDPQKNSWEANSISLNTTDADDLSRRDIQRVMELISSALSDPLSPAEDNAEQKEADRLKCATSVVHQADQACRRHVSEAMKTAREHRVPTERMRSLAAQLNESKAAFLHNLRRRLLQEEPFAQEEDVDVERVAKRAADAFHHETKEILLRITSENK